MDDRTVFFLGAGFSRCIRNGDAPLMRGFFASLDAEAFPLLHEYIDKHHGGVQNADFERVVCSLDQYCELPCRVERRARLIGDIDPQLLLEHRGVRLFLSGVRQLDSRSVSKQRQ